MMLDMFVFSNRPIYVTGLSCMGAFAAFAPRRYMLWENQSPLRLDPGPGYQVPPGIWIAGDPEFYGGMEYWEETDDQLKTGNCVVPGHTLENLEGRFKNEKGH